MQHAELMLHERAFYANCPSSDNLGASARSAHKPGERMTAENELDNKQRSRRDPEDVVAAKPHEPFV